MIDPFDLDITRNLALDEIQERIRALGHKIDRSNEDGDKARRDVAAADQRVAEHTKMRADYQAILTKMST
jgi:hypothetical protein